MFHLPADSLTEQYVFKILHHLLVFCFIWKCQIYFVFIQIILICERGAFIVKAATITLVTLITYVIWFVLITFTWTNISTIRWYFIIHKGINFNPVPASLTRGEQYYTTVDDCVDDSNQERRLKCVRKKAITHWRARRTRPGERRSRLPP